MGGQRVTTEDNRVVSVFSLRSPGLFTIELVSRWGTPSLSSRTVPRLVVVRFLVMRRK